MVCDDYASKSWPALQAAIDALVKSEQWNVLALSTCQLLIFKK